MGPVREVVALREISGGDAVSNCTTTRFWRELSGIC
jgi:hypothetical protein